MTGVLRLEFNEQGRDFVVGDIHGCFSLLEEALAQAAFNPEHDRLISVGDMVNRGPESHRAVEFLQKDWFYAVRGNHEEAVVRELEQVKRGAINTLIASYLHIRGMGWLTRLSSDQCQQTIQAFRALPYAIEIDTPKGPLGVVHADIPKDMDWQSFTESITDGDQRTCATATKGRSRINRFSKNAKKHKKGRVEGAYRVFFGHTPQQKSVTRLGNAFYIDTGAKYWVARQHRKSHLTLVETTADKKDITQKVPRHHGIHVVLDKN